MFKRLYILKDEEDETSGGDGTESSEDESSEEDINTEEDSTEDDGTEEDKDSEDSEEEVIELPQELSHLKDIAELSPEQVNALVNNATNFARLSQDPYFKEFVFRAAQRLSGIDVPEPSDNSKSDTNKNNDLPEDLSDLDDREVLERYLDEKIATAIEAGLAKRDEAFSPILEDYSNRKVEALRKEYSNFDELLPRIEQYRKQNPAAAKLPIEDIIKIVDYESAGTRKVDKLRKNKTKIVSKPRGGSPNGKTKYSQEEINKMPLVKVLEISAKEEGITLQE